MKKVISLTLASVLIIGCTFTVFAHGHGRQNYSCDFNEYHNEICAVGEDCIYYNDVDEDAEITSEYHHQEYRGGHHGMRNGGRHYYRGNCHY